MSLGRRIELTRQVRELLGRMQFCAAGEDIVEKLEAAECGSAVDGLFVRWGLMEIEGLDIDGARATPETLIAAGPEELVREIAARIREGCQLTEPERKN
jgi:hypothetical protein